MKELKLIYDISNLRIMLEDNEEYENTSDKVLEGVLDILDNDDYFFECIGEYIRNNLEDMIDEVKSNEHK